MSAIATLYLVTSGGEAVHMTMQDTGLWTGNDRVLVDFLNDWYSGLTSHSPCRGVLGEQMVELAALRLRARLEWHRGGGKHDVEEVH